MSYPRHSLRESCASTEMQSMYSSVPIDLSTLVRGDLPVCRDEVDVFNQPDQMVQFWSMKLKRKIESKRTYMSSLVSKAVCFLYFNGESRQVLLHEPRWKLLNISKTRDEKIYIITIWWTGTRDWFKLLYWVVTSCIQSKAYKFKER